MDSYFIHRVESGLYNYLPYYNHILSKLIKKIEIEHNKIQCERLLNSSLTPSRFYTATSREVLFQEELFKLEDRRKNKLFLSCTAEEVMTEMIVSRVKNLNQLPIRVYQISEKFRDEIRPQYGIIRSRSFHMVDGYSFGINEESVKNDYKDFYNMYCKIFSELGITFKSKTVQDSTMLSSANEEFICTDTSLTPQLSEGLEIGHIFYLGDEYSRKLNLSIKGRNNESLYVHSGSYGIGIARVMALIIEKIYNGSLLDYSIQPFNAIFIPRNYEDDMYKEAISTGEKADVLIDNYYYYNYEFRLKNSKKMGIRIIVFEKNNSLIVKDLKTNEERVVQKENIQNIIRQEQRDF